MLLRLFENRVLRKIFGPNTDEVTGKQRRLHKEEFNDLCSSPHTAWVIKSRSMRWVEQVACIEERRGAYSVVVRMADGKRPTTWKTGVHGCIILNGSSKNGMARHELG
jgi:hypothetical protein